MKRIPILLVLFALSLLARSGASAGGPPEGALLSNVELMQLAVRGSVLEALQGLPLEEAGTIRLRADAPSEIDWFVENEVARVLQALGAGLEIAPSSGGSVRRHSPGKRSSGAPLLEADYDKAPEFTVNEGIPYPGKACRKGMEGSVTALLLLNEAGAVANLIVEESTDPVFEEAVDEGVGAFRFTPAEREGEPVAAMIRMRFDFPVPEGDCEGTRVEGVILTGDEEEPEEEPEGGEEPARPEAAVQPEDPAGAGKEAVLTFRVSEMELRYPRVFRRFWIGPKRVDRLARTRIDFRLIEDSRLLWANSAEHLVADRVPHGALPFLETDQFPFARPEMPEGGAGRFLEPLVVAGAIGGLIILFYANQANN